MLVNDELRHETKTGDHLGHTESRRLPAGAECNHMRRKNGRTCARPGDNRAGVIALANELSDPRAADERREPHLISTSHENTGRLAQGGKVHVTIGVLATA